MTLEDPIEFVHQHRNCVVNQREVFADTHSFNEALRHVLRQDPRRRADRRNARPRERCSRP
jgi:twitching motility protein PilT